MKNRLIKFLRALAFFVLATYKPDEEEIDAAVRYGFKEAGLNASLYSEDFDLLHSGKFHEVLIHSSRAIGNPLTTVADLKDLLR